MKETSELVNAIFATAAQAVKSFAGGFKLIELSDFIDEALLYQAAVEGLKENIKLEHINATAQDIEDLYVEPQRMLSAVGLNPMIIGGVISAFKGIHYTYTAIAKSGGELQSEDMKVIVNNAKPINNRLLKTNDIFGSLQATG